MRKALAAILVAIGVQLLTYQLIGGAFDKSFWLTFLPGLLTNLIVLLIAVFIVDRIFQRERWTKLEQINAIQTKHVLFLNNRLAFWLLEYLDLVQKTEIDFAKNPNFEFVLERRRHEAKYIKFCPWRDHDARRSFRQTRRADRRIR